MLLRKVAILIFLLRKVAMLLRKVAMLLRKVAMLLRKVAMLLRKVAIHPRKPLVLLVFLSPQQKEQKEQIKTNINILFF